MLRRTQAGSRSGPFRVLRDEHPLLRMLILRR